MWRHFRAESQTEEGEAKRQDEKFAYVAAWEFTGEGKPPVLHKEDLIYKDIELKTTELQVNITLRIWRQSSPEDKGAIHEYELRGQ